MKRRTLIAGLSSSIGSLGISFAQTKELLIGVADGVTYRASAEADEFYAEVLAGLNKLLTPRRVKLEKVLNYKELGVGLDAQRWDICYVHPGHYAIRAIASEKYNLAALSKSHLNYRASFLVRSDSPIKSYSDLAGKKLVTPDQDSITAWMVRATLRGEPSTAARMPSITTTRFQDAIRFFVENKLVDVGATASGDEVKEWAAAGHSVIKSPGRAVPVKHWLVSSRLKPDDVKIADLLIGISNPVRIGVTEGFVKFDQAVLLELGKWLEGGKVS